VPPLTSPPTNWIREGVRRTKAYSLAGFTTVRCEVFERNSKFVGIKEIPIAQLRTTRFSIDVSTQHLRERYDRIERAIQESRELPPIVVEEIVVEESSKGWVIDDVRFDDEGEI
jgi:hypothetical protein